MRSADTSSADLSSNIRPCRGSLTRSYDVLLAPTVTSPWKFGPRRGNSDLAVSGDLVLLYLVVVGPASRTQASKGLAKGKFHPQQVGGAAPPCLVGLGLVVRVRPWQSQRRQSRRHKHEKGLFWGFLGLSRVLSVSLVHLAYRDGGGRVDKSPSAQECLDSALNPSDCQAQSGMPPKNFKSGPSSGQRSSKSLEVLNRE